MEVECPDVWPEIRVLPSGFEVEWAGCCGGWVYYYGSAYGFKGVMWHLFINPMTHETQVAFMGRMPESHLAICANAEFAGITGTQCCRPT